MRTETTTLSGAQAHVLRPGFDVLEVERSTTQLDRLGDALSIVRHAETDEHTQRSALFVLIDATVEEIRNLYLAVHDPDHAKPRSPGDQR